MRRIFAPIGALAECPLSRLQRTSKLNPPPDHLTKLRAERDDLAEQYARLLDQRDRILALESEEAAILAEIDEIGRREVEAVREWAKDPKGNPPAPLIEERAAAARRLAEAQASCTAGRVVVSELDASLSEIHRRQLTLEPAIAAAIFDTLTADYGRLLGELRTSITKVRANAAEAFALFDAMREEAQRLQGAGKVDEARELFVRMEHLECFDLTAIGPTEAEIAAEVARWRARAAALRTGAAK